MQRSEVIEAIKDHIVEQVLDGKSIGLDETTPLLEWGVINSLEIIQLLNFFRTRFHIHISAESLTADRFVNLVAIADLVLETSMQQEQGAEKVVVKLSDE